MYKLLWLSIYLCCYGLFAQEVDRIQEPVSIISSRNVYLNSGLVSRIEGNSRSVIQVDLPSNTIKWYYSFTTSLSKRKTLYLNLAEQLIALYEDNQNQSDKASHLDVPPGKCGIDIYLLNKNNIQPFLDKADLKGGTYTYTLEGTVHNTKQAVVEVAYKNKSTVYLGLKNPGNFLGANIIIEVVAITETPIETKKSDRQHRAELLGHAAEDELKQGNFKKCIAYCDEALTLYTLGRVQGYKGLAQLRQGRSEEALQTFFEAIVRIKMQENSSEVFKDLLIILEDLKNEQPELPEVTKIITMIKVYYEETRN